MQIVFGMLLGILIAIIVIAFFGGKWLVNSKMLIRKYRSLYETSSLWASKAIQERKVSSWMIENGYEKVAVYGMGALGKTLCIDLQSSGCNVIGIDKNRRAYCENVNIFNLEENIPDVDIMVVTPVYEYSLIARELGKSGFRCVSLATIIEEI